MANDPVLITSIDDERIALFRDVRDRDLASRSGHFLAESSHIVRQLLQKPQLLRALLMTESRYRSLANAVQKSGFDGPVYLAELDLLSQISGFHLHRGVLALGSRPAAEERTVDVLLQRLTTERQKNSERVHSTTILMAEGLTNVDNMGSMFRLAAGFGVDGIVLDASCCDPLYRKSIRVSMGHVFSVPFAISEAWLQDLAAIRDCLGLTVLAMESGVNGAEPWNVPLTGGVGIIVGSEGFGLSHETLAVADLIVEIPMSGGTASVNVANATSALLYEILRQRHQT